MSRTAEKLADAIKGGPKICPFCDEEIRSVTRRIVETREDILIWEQPKTKGFYEKNGYGRITAREESYLCPHCERKLPWTTTPVRLKPG